ncbi:serpin family protein [Lentzea sp. NPDC006480]|uniref:serpin family protein n=1 Tax=Lentzea sp. NPDC006480 TaxID=3157176 RepID=UPI0033A4D411
MTDQAGFALNLHRVAVPDPSENACWSPLSVASALSLAREAARGRTRAELDALLGDFDPADSLDVPGLAVANTLWASDRLVLNPGFSLASSVRRTDFRDHVTARKLINADVEQTTRGLIPELLAQVSPDAVAYLVNALYLKAGWETPFQRGATKPRLFHAPGGDVEVPTMTVTAELGHTRHDGWLTLGLPATSGVEVLVLVPDWSLEQPLDPSVFEVDDSARVALSLPEVDVRARFELTGTLQTVGVAALFSPAAQLSGLSPDALHVSEVVHEAVLRVDEKGLEGAAATAMGMTRGGRRLREEPIVVTVDRPFLLAVRHARSKAIYFLAQVARP